MFTSTTTKPEGEGGEVLGNASDIHLYTGYKANTFIFPGSLAPYRRVVMVISHFLLSRRTAGLAVLATRRTKTASNSTCRAIGSVPRIPVLICLNTLPPKDHVAALKKENEIPASCGPLRKFGFDSMFEYVLGFHARCDDLQQSF